MLRDLKVKGIKVLGIGEIVIDKSIFLNNYPAEGEKCQPQKIEYSVGGPAPAAILLLASLGCRCKLISSIGTDNQANKIKTILKRKRVKFIPIIQKQTKENLVLCNLKNGSRTIIRSEIRHNPINSISPQTIKEADLIILDRHEPKAFELVVKHKRKDTIIISDPSTEFSPKTVNMMKNSYYAIIPIETLEKARKYENKLNNLKFIYKFTKKPVIVTAGKYGSIIYDGKELKMMPSYKVKVVDTLGAGDVYRGAFGYGIMQNWDLERTVNFSNAVAALQCTKHGNGNAIPSKKEINDFLKKGKKNKVDIKEILN
jgi:sulfofructose kinase